MLTMNNLEIVKLNTKSIKGNLMRNQINKLFIFFFQINNF